MAFRDAEKALVELDMRTMLCDICLKLSKIYLENTASTALSSPFLSPKCVRVGSVHAT